LLFGRFDSDNSIDSEIQQCLQHFGNLEIDLHFLGFGAAGKNTTKLNDNFSLFESLDITFFQNKIVSKLENFTELGYNKTIICSCSYQIKNLNFLDKNLIFVYYDDLDFEKHKNINHRFMYGRTSLIKRIWENRPFDVTKDLDKNLFLNTFNVIGLKKMNENKVLMDQTIQRIGWSSQ
jgi:hypothetical protein